LKKPLVLFTPQKIVQPCRFRAWWDLSDEEVVEFWSESAYAQYFCGEREMRWGLPCDPSELTHFRKRIGIEGAERILASTIDLHGKKAKEKEVIVDNTVQEPKRSGDRLPQAA
jgi:hypothetical protein